MPAAGSKRRIAVTGLGVVCALGLDQREFWAAAVEGRHGIRRLDLFDPTGCLSDLAGQVAGADRAGSPARGDRRASRADLLCAIAAREAVEQAGLAVGRGEPLASFGVSLGTSASGMLESERYCRDGLRLGFDRARPSAVLRLPSSTPADTVARLFAARGPRESNMTACASSAISIGHAADLIREGAATGMIAGGGDALCLMTYAGFNALRLLDPRPCRPFDAGRQGLSLGEGAGLMILEDWEHASARGARPLAEFLDYGSSCDASHMTAPHPEGRGAAAAMREAIDRSGLSPNDIGHINAHGTGTPLNDAAEAVAIASVFGRDRPARLPITSTKSLVGHLLGGCGGIEAVALVLSLMRQIVPPTLGFSTPDQGPDLDVVAPHARKVSFEHGLSNSFGFGGTNCSLVFKRCG